MIRARTKHNGDYLPAHNFKLEIDGVIVGGFKEISGLETEVEVIEYKDGDDQTMRKRAGKVKFKNIIMKRGQVSDDSITKWFKAVIEGKTERKSGSIIVLDREGKEIMRHNFFEAWPCRHKMPDHNSLSDTHIVEEVEFVVEKVERGS